MKRRIETKPWAVLFWLLVWQLGAMAMGREILLPTPLRVLSRLGALCVTPGFWLAILHSLRRIAGGFLLATAAGTLLAAASARFGWVRQLLAPLMLAVRSVPVASFVILALVWVSSKNLAVLIVFLMVLPVIYLNVQGGIDRLDPKLSEMARVFRVPPLRRALRVALPQLLPPFLNGCELALGLCWKAGAAAEVIGMPKGSIGERLQQAKVYLDTPDLFAWTLVIVVVSWAFGRLTLGCFGAIGRALAGLPRRRGR
ncbi:MAG: ABC transporter permease subunit [Clostridia bacterium]|nr:ABC transporter permease subunit [Clostridia bacterium]